MNLDILIRIRDQLAGLNRAQQGLVQFRKEAQESNRSVGQMAQALGPAGSMLQRLAGPFTLVAAAAMTARSAYIAFDTALRDPKRYSATEQEAEKITVLKKNLEAFAAPIRVFTDSEFRAETAAAGLRRMSDLLGFAEEARSAVAARAAEQALTTRRAELEAEHTKRLADEAQRVLGYYTELAQSRQDAAGASDALREYGAAAPDLDRMRRMRDSYAGTAANTDLSELSRSRAKTEADKLSLQIRQEEASLNEKMVAVGDRQEQARVAKLALDQQIAAVAESLLETERRIAALPKNKSNADLATGTKLEDRKVDLELQLDQLKAEQASRASATERLRLDAALTGIQQRRAALSADYSRTEAEKWSDQRALILSAIEAQKKYLANLATRATDKSLPEATRLEAESNLTSGRSTLGGMQNDLAGLGPDPFSTIEQLKASLTSLKESWGTTAQQIAQGFSGVIGTAMQGTSDALYDWISGAATAKDAWLGALQSIGQSFLRMITDMVAKMIWRSTVERALIALGVMTHVQGETAKTAATTTGGGIRLLTGIKEALASVYKGALFAFEALASIPYVGPFLGAAAMAAAIAGGIALVSKIGHADGGYIAGPGSGTSDSIPAMLSNGEYVIPADKVQQYGRGFFDSIRSGSFLAGAAPSNNSALQSYGIAAAVAPAAAPESGAGGVGEMAIGVFDRRTAVEDFLNSKRGQKILFDAHRNTARQIG